MKISDFNEYLTPLPAKILREEKTYLLMGDFNINLLNKDTDHNISDSYDILSLNFEKKTLKLSLIIFFQIQLNLIPFLTI